MISNLTLVNCFCKVCSRFYRVPISIHVPVPDVSQSGDMLACRSIHNVFSKVSRLLVAGNLARGMRRLTMFFHSIYYALLLPSVMCREADEINDLIRILC